IMRLMGQTFVMGSTIEEAVRRADEPGNRGFTASFDMLGEAARTYGDAERYFRSYEGSLDALSQLAAGTGHSISVKLSALLPRYETGHAAICVPALIERVTHPARKAAASCIDLTIDAEESERLMM